MELQIWIRAKLEASECQIALPRLFSWCYFCGARFLPAHSIMSALLCTRFDQISVSALELFRMGKSCISKLKAFRVPILSNDIEQRVGERIHTNEESSSFSVNFLSQSQHQQYHNRSKY